jgi:archaellum biogenesis protein FlaJ (TadC family)
MNYQQLRPTTSQTRRTIGFGLIVIAVLLVVAIVAGLLSPHKDVTTVCLNIIASICILAGVVGLYVTAARQFDLWLPLPLQVPEKSRDERWRLLALSVAAIAFPLLILWIQWVLTLIIQQSLFH